MKPFSLLLLLLATLVAGGAVAGPVPLPEVPAAKGEQCIEDSAVMRRNHPDYLKHQRDATMRQGIRTTKYSLKECLDCHVPTKEEAVAMGAKGEQHFCKSCHQYAGVKVDCFECHASRPERTPAFHPMTAGMERMREAHGSSAAMLNRLAADESAPAKLQ